MHLLVENLQIGFGNFCLLNFCCSSFFLVLLKSSFSPRSLCHFSISPQPCDQDQPTNSSQDFYLPLHVAPWGSCRLAPQCSTTPYLRMKSLNFLGKLERLMARIDHWKHQTLGPQTCLATIICSNFAWCFDMSILHEKNTLETPVRITTSIPGVGPKKCRPGGFHR